MRFILVTDNGCLASMTARNWAQGLPIEIVDKSEAESIESLYGIVKYPTLLSLGEYGIVSGRVDGFNADKYNELVNDK